MHKASALSPRSSGSRQFPHSLGQVGLRQGWTYLKRLKLCNKSTALAADLKGCIFPAAVVLESMIYNAKRGGGSSEDHPLHHGGKQNLG